MKPKARQPVGPVRTPGHPVAATNEQRWPSRVQALGRALIMRTRVAVYGTATSSEVRIAGHVVIRISCAGRHAQP